jgi:hypothetical protein
MLTGFERLDLPESYGVVTAVAGFVVPAAGIILPSDNYITCSLSDLREVGEVDSEATVEGVGFRKSVGGDSVLVNPLVLANIAEFFGVSQCPRKASPAKPVITQPPINTTSKSKLTFGDHEKNRLSKWR